MIVTTSAAIAFLAGDWLAIRLLALAEALSISVWLAVIGTGTAAMVWFLRRRRVERP